MAIVQLNKSYNWDECCHEYNMRSQGSHFNFQRGNITTKFYSTMKAPLSPFQVNCNLRTTKLLGEITTEIVEIVSIEIWIVRLKFGQSGISVEKNCSHMTRGKAELFEGELLRISIFKSPALIFLDFFFT